jgi:hypothetical protein
MLMSMFLRCHKRLKDGKEHRYYSIEESRRLQSGRVVQRRVLYLGEINDSQQAAWRRTLEVFEDGQRGPTTLSLFPDDRPVPADAVDSVQVKLSECSCAGRGHLGTVGWGASCGDNWSWIGSGNRNCPAAASG